MCSPPIDDMIDQFRGDLQIDEDMAFQRSVWRVQRVAWMIMALVALAALAGAFGDGILAEAKGTAGRASVEYPRLARYVAPLQLRLTLPVSEQQAWIAIDQGYLGKIRIQQIVPAPAGQRASVDETRFLFHGAGASMTVHINAETGQAGIVRGRLRTADGEIIIRSFVFP